MMLFRCVKGTFKHITKDMPMHPFHGSRSGCNITQLSAHSPMHNLITTQQIGEYVSREVDGSIIDLSVGQPSPRLLPLEAIRTAAASRFIGAQRMTTTSDAPLSAAAGEGVDDAALLLQYGPRQGYPSFR
jgi:hypothetical protein